MAEEAGFFDRVFGAKKKAPLVTSSAPESEEQPVSPFGVFGERGETLGEQLVSFNQRLEDLLSLRDEFSLVAKPMREFVTSHAAAQTRLSEANALLARERSDTKALRLDVGDLRKLVAQQENALATARSHAQSLEDAAVARDAELKHAQVSNSDLSARLDWANREVAIQTGAARDKDAAHRMVADEVSRLEHALTEATATATEVRDRSSGQEAEIQRLTHLVDHLQPQLTMAKRRVSDLGADLHSASLTIGSQEFKIAGEQEARRKAETAHAESIMASDAEIARLLNEIESLKTKHEATQRLFEQSRELVAEKTEAVRASDRAAKEALAEKVSLERRLVVANEEARRLKDKLAEAARGAEEARERATMLANAMGAKDRQIEQLKNRSETIASQLDDTVSRFERERTSLEADNRRLIEENQTEKAERALAQGALQISRASREKLLHQIEDLKRGRGPRPDHEASGDATGESEVPSNVHRLPATEAEHKRDQPKP